MSSSMSWTERHRLQICLHRRARRHALTRHLPPCDLISRNTGSYNQFTVEYHPQDLDKKWQQRWAASRAFEVTADPSKPKFYCLEMFAYPSGHAHMGHVRNYSIGDALARTKRMRGFNVLHPFG